MVTTIATMNRMVITRPSPRWRRKLRWPTPITTSERELHAGEEAAPAPEQADDAHDAEEPGVLRTELKRVCSSVCASLGKNARIAFNAFVFASGDRVA